MGHTIAQWEAAIKRRDDIQFNEIYLTDGLVRTVIGTVLQPSKRDANHMLTRRVRWNALGVCSTVSGQGVLLDYCITFK